MNLNLNQNQTRIKPQYLSKNETFKYTTMESKRFHQKTKRTQTYNKQPKPLNNLPAEDQFQRRLHSTTKIILQFQQKQNNSKQGQWGNIDIRKI